MLKYPYLCNSFLVTRDNAAREQIVRLVADNRRLRDELSDANLLADREETAVLGRD